MTEDGQISADISGIGGFLSAAERDIAVPMSAISVVREEGNSDDRFLVVSSTKGALEAMPSFECSMSDAPAITAATTTAYISTVPKKT